MKALDLANVEDRKEFSKVQPGGYICRIESVQDVVEKEYLKIEYDFAEGEHKHHYFELFQAKGFWGGRFIRSYKEKALPFFKGFITAVENSNPGYKWDNDERKLLTKFVGIVLAEEEYRKNDGKIGTRLYVDQTRSVDEIRKGNYKVPELKRLQGADSFGASVPANDVIPGWE